MLRCIDIAMQFRVSTDSDMDKLMNTAWHLECRHCTSSMVDELDKTAMMI